MFRNCKWNLNNVDRFSKKLVSNVFVQEKRSNMLPTYPTFEATQVVFSETSCFVFLDVQSFLSLAMDVTHGGAHPFYAINAESNFSTPVTTAQRHAVAAAIFMAVNAAGVAHAKNIIKCCIGFAPYHFLSCALC
jgi:hypothetical protein